ncbi:MAG: glutamate--tRNA ligase [Deltaproteobacteria bacterium]|jgi:glutamyl-tRNA synthetase|nr:glutamate--tRNA ligase [Deltaproteobacteria bacterium]
MKTRFAPSPTGYLHIGGARTALFNWLLARHEGGTFAIRIEDTDQTRSLPEFTEDILASLKWLGLDHDGEIHFQTHRLEIYQSFVTKLLESNQAYYCHCSKERLEESRAIALKNKAKPRYDGKCRELHLGPAPGSVVRFKSPLEGDTSWPDIIKGPIIFKNEELDDLVILRADGLPTYNLAVVADDASFGITHVLRGDDHVNNTPRQIQLYQALGLDLPAFGHLPMILGGDKQRLSKRHGATSVLAYREMGYLPQALVNYLARLGWSHGDQEIFSLPELVKYFNLSSVGKSAAVFNMEKLDWLNSHYLKELEVSALAEQLWPFLAKDFSYPGADFLEKVTLTLRERAKTLTEMATKARFYFVTDLEINPFDAKKHLTPQGKKILADFVAPIRTGIPDNAAFNALLEQLVATHGQKKTAIAQPLRVALTGSSASPGLFEIIEILGPEKSLQRIQKALEYTS